MAHLMGAGRCIAQAFADGARGRPGKATKHLLRCKVRAAVADEHCAT